MKSAQMHIEFNFVYTINFIVVDSSLLIALSVLKKKWPLFA